MAAKASREALHARAQSRVDRSARLLREDAPLDALGPGRREPVGIRDEASIAARCTGVAIRRPPIADRQNLPQPARIPPRLSTNAGPRLYQCSEAAAHRRRQRSPGTAVRCALWSCRVRRSAGRVRQDVVLMWSWATLHLPFTNARERPSTAARHRRLPGGESVSGQPFHLEVPGGAGNARRQHQRTSASIISGWPFERGTRGSGSTRQQCARRPLL